jgi:NAD+ kinase
MERNTIKRIGILAKTHHTLSSFALNKVIQFLKDNDYEYWIEQGGRIICPRDSFDQLVPAEEMIAKIDLMIVLGGDGTFLWAARLLQNTAIPIFGINLGRLGFLTEITVDEIADALNLLKENKLQTEERAILKARLFRNKKVIAEHYCLNDVVMNKSAIARVIDMELSLQDEVVTQYKADGLIISTPTGSTAYSLAAGGSLMHPLVHAFLITPICPHMLTQRSIIIPDHFGIKVRLLTAKEEVLLTLDGQIAYPLHQNDEVVIQKNEKPIYIAKSPFKSYFNILRSKLKWGEG